MSAKVVLNDEITNKIKDLAASGMSARKIKKELDKQGFNISLRQVTKVANTISVKKDWKAPANRTIEIPVKLVIDRSAILKVLHNLA